jgi:hypothetical protein
MVVPLKKASLSPARRQLLERFQQLNFGRLEGMVVRDRQPVLDPPPTIIREVKFGAENGSRSELQADDFILKSQVVELFAAFDDLRDGVVEVLEVKHGLPFRMLIREAAV